MNKKRKMKKKKQNKQKKKHGCAGVPGETCVAFLWVYPQEWYCWIIRQVYV
jgi:hypothetical protein